MDPALPACTEVDNAFAELGFDKVDRYRIREDIDLLSGLRHRPCYRVKMRRGPSSVSMA